MPREIAGKDPVSLSVVDYALAPLQAGEVRVKVEYASPKHGTELHGFVHGPDDVPTYYDDVTHTFLPQTPEMLAGARPGLFRPGNMWVGHIIEAGPDTDGYAVGDRVAGYGPIREVQTVRVGVENTPGIGIINDVLRMPEDMSWKAALCYDPCQFALCGVRDSQLRLGDTCCVTGLGAIGQMAAQLARLQGAKTVIVSDPIAHRREIALKNGADYAIDPTAEDAGLRVKQITGGGADVFIETSGSYPGLQSAFRGVTYGGRIAVVGWFGRDRGGIFDLGHEAHMNNATLFFSRACSEPNPDYPRWSWTRINATCWELLRDGRIHCDDIIDPVVPFEQAGDAYRKYVVENPALSAKLGVEF